MVYLGQSNYKAPTVEEIREDRKKRPVIYMLTVYGDESYDHGAKRVFAISGVIGTQEEWDSLEPIWLERTQRIPFHATDCESGYGDYKGISKDERHQLYRDLVQILVKTPLWGFGNVIDAGAYKVYFPYMPPDSFYMYCFRRVIEKAREMASYYIPRQKAELVFDMNLDVKHNATDLFHYYCEHCGSDYSQYLDKISFSRSRDSVGLQVADLWARELMKQGDNAFYNSNKRNIRLSFRALHDTGRFIFAYYTKSYFEDYRDKFKEIQEHVGITERSYNEWLLTKNIKTDNWNSRLKYFRYLDRVKHHRQPI